MDPLTQKIEEQIKTLPSVTRRALHDFDWKNQILGIGRMYDLNLDQLDTLEQETTLVLVGLIPANKYVSEIKKRLEISTTAASQIVEEANKKIFIPIRDMVLQYAEEDNDQHQTLRDAGIHIEEDTEDLTEEMVTLNESTPKTEMTVSIPEKDTELPSMPIKNSIEQKMSGLHTATQVVSGQSTNTADLPPIPKKPKDVTHDPYRETII